MATIKLSSFPGSTNNEGSSISTKQASGKIQLSEFPSAPTVKPEVIAPAEKVSLSPIKKSATDLFQPKEIYGQKVDAIKPSGIEEPSELEKYQGMSPAEIIGAKASEIGKTASSIGKSIILSIPQTFYQGVKSIFESEDSKISNLSNPAVKAVYEKVKREKGEAAAEEYLQAPLGDAIKDVDDKIKSLINEPVTKFSDQVLNILDNRQQELYKDIFDEKQGLTKPSEYAYTIAQGAVSLAEAIGIYALTKNSTIAAGVLSAAESTSVYQEARDKGKTPDEARKIMAQSGMGTFLLEKVGLDYLFKTKVGGKLLEAAKTSFVETLQEEGQTVWQNTVAKNGYDNSIGYFDGWWETAVGIAIPSFGAGMFNYSRINTQRTDLIRDVQDKTGVSEKEATNFVESLEDKIDATEEQAKDIIDQPTKLQQIENKIAMEQATPAPEMAPMEPGTIKEEEAIIPPAEKEMAPKTEIKAPVDITEEARKFSNPKTFIEKQPKYFRGSDKIESTININTDPSLTYGPAVYLTDNESIAKEYGKNVSEIFPTSDLKLRTLTNSERGEIVNLFGEEQKKYIDSLLGKEYNGFLVPEWAGDGNEIVVYDKNLLRTKTQLEKVWTKAQLKGKVKVEKPEVKKVEVDTKKIGTLEQELRTKYLESGADKVEEEMGKIFFELDLAEKGERFMTDDGVWIGKKSSFPDWIPEELRSQKLFNKVIEGLYDVNKLSFPDKNKSKQRELYNAILDELDDRLDVDTSSTRNRIVKEYEGIKEEEPTREIREGIEGGEGIREQKEVTQKEKVAEAVKEKPKTIKEISEETKILEPNVRRILGVGAKEGTFERVEKGVYILKKDGQDIAWIEAANSVEALPRLAKEGFKADMTFLDIPYDTPAVKGGNRGVKYNLVSVEDFSTVLDAVKEISKTENSPVVYMYSQAESGLKAMAKYNDLFIEKGFKPVGKGQLQKTFADGSPVTSPNGKISRPEGILVFTKSGELNKDLKNLNFTLKRPKGYQTEKPSEMLKAMIEMTTEEGDIVLDPFAGSGVTGAEAIRAGRKAYLIEKDVEVAEKITKPRIQEAIKETETKTHEQLEKEIYDYSVENREELINKYEKQFGNFLGGDNILELFPEYQKDRTRHASFRKSSNYLWNQILDRWTTTKQDKADNTALIMMGGPAVGKSTAARATIGKDFTDKYSFVIEITGQKKAPFESLKKRILDNDFGIHIVEVYADIDSSFKRALARAQENGGANDGKGRTVYIPEYVNRHLGAIEIGREAAEKDNPDVRYNLILNQGAPEDAKIYEPKEALAILDRINYNKKDEEQLIQKYYDETIQAYQQGKISKAVYEGTTGLLGSAEEASQGKHRIDSSSIGKGTKRGSEDLIEVNTQTLLNGNISVDFNRLPHPQEKDAIIRQYINKGYIDINFHNKTLIAKPYNKGTVSGQANMGIFSEGTPVLLGEMKNIKPIQTPELVNLVKELTGAAPTINKRLRTKRGVFWGRGYGEIQLNPNIFNDPVQVAKTLAHEIGHLTDWLPQLGIKRSSLLQKLYILKNHLKTEFGEELVKNQDIKDELWNLSTYWRPLGDNPSDGFLKYRKSGSELYADAVSVLFNSPGLLEQRAPKFYRAFFKSLDEKPSINEKYWEIQDLLSGAKEQLFEARENRIKKGFAKAEDIQKSFETKKEKAENRLGEQLRQQLDDRYYPVLKKVQEAEAKGKIIDDNSNPKYLLQETSLVNNENYLLVDKMDREISKPIKAAGMSDDDIGIYLMLKRIMNERQNIANPFGFDINTATDQLEYLKERVGEENFKLLEEKVNLFHDLVFSSVERAVEVGSYNKELFEKNIKPNKDTYATFSVVDYLQDYVPATIKKQVGTFKEIANPYYLTILKTCTLNKLNSVQEAKNSTIKLLQENFPDEIEKSKEIRSGKLSIFKQAKDRGQIQLLEDGKLKSYDVDPYIAKSFEYEDPDNLNIAIRLLDRINNTFKSLVTTYNLGFAAAFNPIRDFKRNYKNIPNASLFNLTKAYIQSLPSAARYAQGKLDDITRQMVEEKLINAPMYDYNYDPRDDGMGTILEKYGIIKRDTPEKQLPIAIEAARKFTLTPLIKTLEAIRFVANTFENVSKVAGMRVRIDRGEEGKELAYNVRNFTGTPNWKVKGTQTNTTNAVFIFSNIMKEGLKSDFIIATDPKTRSGYWWKSVKIDFMPKFLMFLAAAGLFGGDLKDLFDKMTEYDKTNYICIPIGERNGKVVYFRIPHDETNRIMSSIFWKSLNFMKDKNLNGLQDIMAIGAGQLPNVTPVITILQAWGQYLTGKNPYDAFRGQTLINDTVFKAGGVDSLKKMVQWTANSFGLSQFTTYDASKNDGVEIAVQVLPLINRLVKISDYGISEKSDVLQKSMEKATAQEQLKEKDLINKYVKKYKDDYASGEKDIYEINDILTKELLGHDPNDEEEDAKYDSLKVRLKRAMVVGVYDARFDNIVYAGTNKIKVALLKQYQRELNPEDYNSLLESLYDEKVISNDVYDQVQ